MAGDYVGVIVVGIIAIAVLMGFIAVRVRRAKGVGTVCKTCKGELGTKDVLVSVGDLRKETLRGSNSISIRYYCYIYYYAECPKCGKKWEFKIKHILYNSDWGRTTLGRTYNSLVDKVKSKLPKNFYGNEEPVICNSKTLMEEIELQLCD
ncbi:MAG: hypothetical protein IJF44_03680 [Clostridia bacterium]|nr:hypothetical protein [Clostridia bacterium]